MKKTCNTRKVLDNSFMTTGLQLKAFRLLLPRQYRSQEKFAAQIGYTAKQISNVERKNLNLSEELMEVIEKFKTKKRFK